MRQIMDKSRADEVRKRRHEQTQKRLAASSALATRPLAPIISRGGPVVASPRRAAMTGTQRHYQAALSMPGIEVRMPAISFTDASVKWRAISILLTILLSAALYLAWTAPELQTGQPQVTGNERIAANDIDSALGVSGHPIFTVAPAELEARLRLTFPELTSAHVSVSLPNEVLVSVTERKPLIVWEQNGAYTWIDENGVAFRPRGAAGGLIPVQALAAPPSGVAQGSDPLSPLPYVSTDLITAIKTLAPSVPSGTSILYDPRYGLGWTDSRGWRVFFGSNAKDMALRLEVYQALAGMLAGKGVTPAMIDVQYPSAPYYRMAQ